MLDIVFFVWWDCTFYICGKLFMIRCEKYLLFYFCNIDNVLMGIANILAKYFAMWSIIMSYLKQKRLIFSYCKWYVIFLNTIHILKILVIFRMLINMLQNNVSIFWWEKCWKFCFINFISVPVKERVLTFVFFFNS